MRWRRQLPRPHSPIRPSTGHRLARAVARLLTFSMSLALVLNLSSTLSTITNFRHLYQPHRFRDLLLSHRPLFPSVATVILSSAQSWMNFGNELLKPERALDWSDWAELGKTFCEDFSICRLSHRKGSRSSRLNMPIASARPTPSPGFSGCTQVVPPGLKKATGKSRSDFN